MSIVCNPLHLYVFTSSATIISAFTPATLLSQPERPNLSIKGNPNPSTNHTNPPLYTLLWTQPSFASKTLCLLSKMASNLSKAQKKAKSSKRKQDECSRAALDRLDTWFTDESKKNNYKMIYVVKNVRIPKYLNLEWFSQQGFNFPNMLEAQGLSNLA